MAARRSAASSRSPTPTPPRTPARSSRTPPPADEGVRPLARTSGRTPSAGRNRIPPERIEPEDDLPPSFITLDDPEHDRLRRIAMWPFGPPHTAGRIDSLVGEMAGVARDLLSGLQGRDVVDIVDDFAYPLAVTMICRLLGVPREDEIRFRAWSEAIIATVGSPGRSSWPPASCCSSPATRRPST